MIYAGNVRRKAARLAQVNDPAATDPAVAGVRLRGALFAAMRAGLTVGDVMELAARIVSGTTTTADAALLDALDVHDLDTVGMSAAAFVVALAAGFRCVAAVLRLPSSTAGSVDAIVSAAGVVRLTGDILRRNLQVLPGPDALARIGSRVMHGAQTSGDLAVIRALPGPYLRATASVDHWRAFVSYRDD